MVDASFLSELEAIAREAGTIARRFQDKLERELKADGSIVTAADRAVEERLRERLVALVPGTTVWGEEFGYAVEGPRGLWAVDPIDGTSNFSYGSPLWGVSIAYIADDEVRAGTVFLPDLDELYTAGRGLGARLNGKALEAIPPGEIQAHELVSYCDGIIKRYPREAWPGGMRCCGAFVVDGCWVATQRYRGLIGNQERLYDVAACMLICGELGGDVRYADGTPILVRDLKQDVKIERPWLMFPSQSGFFSTGES